MKLKYLAVIAVLVLGCSAAFAQNTYTFGFLGPDGVYQYCNYETFTTGGRDNFYMQGYDVLSACPSSSVSSATIVGSAITVPTAAGAPVRGKAYVYADQLFDAYSGTYTGEQWLVITKTAPTKVKFGNYSWVAYIGISGYEFLGGYGFLTTNIPSAATKATNNKSTVSGLGVAQVKAMLGKGLAK
jgi:hypothetical protein